MTGSAPTGSIGFTADGTFITGCSAVALGGSGNARSAACTITTLAAGVHSIVGSYGGDAANGPSSSAPLSQVINSTTSTAGAWVDDAMPSGAVVGGDEFWIWVTSNPAPFSGTLAHQSGLAAGIHQHYFYNATSTMVVGVGDTLFAYVYLDPANPPSEIMLQWNDGSWWDHRAYWGANLVPWGTDGTTSRRYMGALPATGQWVRLAVPAAQVGLEGRTVSGMAYTLYGGRATWDYAGR